MTHSLSFMGANLVAQQIDFNMTEGWGQGSKATEDWFRPLETYEERFNAVVANVREMGFDLMDLWGAHLHFAWATPGHVAVAKRVLSKHNVRVPSYAGGFGSTISEFRASCALCKEMGIPVLGGGFYAFMENREEAVAILREYGLVYAYENHPEGSVEEILAKIGEGDEDVVGVALDTGWLGTNEVDSLDTIRRLGSRLKYIHLKDVLAKRPEKSGLMFVDMGHETCALGDGIIPIKEVLDVLVEIGYTGPLSLEHEPETHDPRPEVKLSAERVKAWQTEAVEAKRDGAVRCAVVGCGNIANAYGTGMQSYAEVRIVGAQDMDRSRAEAFAEKFGGKVYDTLDDVLADDEVDAVVNLTIHHAHVEVITKCLNAGKHVHSEKPIAPTYAEAKGLVDLAVEKNLRLSCAPITYMGESQQTAWKLLREGRIGTPRVVYAEVNWGRIESWHPNPGPFYDVGPVFDVAVYPLTKLTAWFGPAKRVTAAGGVVYPHRQTKDGTPFEITTPDWNCAVVEFANGLLARITANFYVSWVSRQRGIEIHGDDGALILDNWHDFNAQLFVSTKEDGMQPIPPLRPGRPGTEFARGIQEMAQAIQEDRPHRADGSHAAHVVEIMETIGLCVKDGQPRDLYSTFKAPTPMPWGE